MSIGSLQSERQSCINQIVKSRAYITKCERAHTALTNFKNTVTKSEEEFHGLIKAKKSQLLQVENISKNCITAKTYHGGMENIFSVVGEKVIGVVYVALLNRISAKLTFYLNEISYHEGLIVSWQSRISAIDAEIARIEAEMREAERREAQRRAAERSK